MAFKTIETQEELDAIIGERLTRERESTAEKYADYEEVKNNNATLTAENNNLRETIQTLTSEKTELEENYSKAGAKIKEYEMSDMKIKIALQNGIPYDMANRLVGEDEASLIEDAKKMSELIGGKPSPPLKKFEQKGDEENASYLNLISNLKLEGE